MIPGIEEMLLAHLKQHGLHRIDVGVNTYGGDTPFNCTVWWNDDAQPTGLGCRTGNGGTVVEAFGRAVDQMDTIHAGAAA